MMASPDFQEDFSHEVESDFHFYSWSLLLSLVFDLTHSFFCKRNFIRTRVMILVKNETNRRFNGPRPATMKLPGPAEKTFTFEQFLSIGLDFYAISCTVFPR